MSTVRNTADILRLDSSAIVQIEPGMHYIGRADESGFVSLYTERMRTAAKMGEITVTYVVRGFSTSELARGFAELLSDRTKNQWQVYGPDMKPVPKADSPK